MIPTIGVEIDPVGKHHRLGAAFDTAAGEKLERAAATVWLRRVAATAWCGIAGGHG
jgi:hypothetical protein